MIRNLFLSALAAVLTAASASAGQLTFDWAHVGNAGNAADPRTGFGAVAYDYAISKTEVTNVQYTEFLNSVDPTGANALDLYHTDMSGIFGGIQNNGTTAGSRYGVQAGLGQKPVTYVSFLDAMRFTNWLHNGQGDGDTEAGVYTIGSGVDESRSPDARYWIPSEDEWYKAAYHDADAGTEGVYFRYAIGRDSEPISDQPGDDFAAVNYFNDDGIANGFNDGYAVNGSTTFPSLSPYSDVGAYTAALSPYGTFDQNGNVFEWNEGLISVFGRAPTTRSARGGSWDTAAHWLTGSKRLVDAGPSSGHRLIGFRVATVPEPSGRQLTAVAIVAVLLWRRS